MAKVVKSVREQALAMLARREHSVTELRRKLLEKGNLFPDVGVVVDALVAQGLVDDARYAAARARYRALVSHWGAGKIKMELQSVGIDPDLIARAMEGLAEEGVTFAEEARKVAGRRYRGAIGSHVVAEPSLTDAEARAAAAKARQKRIAYLVRRGFTYAEAVAAVEEAALGEA